MTRGLFNEIFPGHFVLVIALAAYLKFLLYISRRRSLPRVLGVLLGQDVRDVVDPDCAVSLNLVLIFIFD